MKYAEEDVGKGDQPQVSAEDVERADTMMPYRIIVVHAVIPRVGLNQVDEF